MAGRRFGLFRQRETLNERLLREAELDRSSVASAAQPDPEPAPVPDPDPASGPTDAAALLGLSPDPVDVLRLSSRGVADPALRKLQNWRPLANVTARLAGTEIRFFALADGSVIVDEQEGDEPLDPLLDALVGQIELPYRALALLVGASVWSISADPIDVVELPGVEADDFVMGVYGGDLAVDGQPVEDEAPYRPLEDLAERRGLTDYAAEATRLEDATFAAVVRPL